MEPDFYWDSICSTSRPARSHSVKRSSDERSGSPRTNLRSWTCAGLERESPTARPERSKDVPIGETRVTVGIPTFNRAALLRESMSSVLAQTHQDFRLLICDNASDDGTQDAVMSFDDPRVDYRRSAENIGMVANFNRTIDLAETELVVLLPDDDILYPDYLRNVVEVAKRYPRVGIVHTAFDLIDSASQVLESQKKLVTGRGNPVLEPGHEYLLRSMRSPWTVCWASVLFRKSALVEADCLREEEEPLSDFPLLMRIACRWDFAFVPHSLAGLRIHADAATAALGDYTDGGYLLLDRQPKILYAQRLAFLEQAAIPPKLADRCRSRAEATFRRDRVRTLAAHAGLDAPWMDTSRTLARFVWADPRTLLVPATWRLCLAQVGGRKAKRMIRQLAERVNGRASRLSTR